ncbi:MAG: CPBP family intramembrane metalloprotease [Oscillospiraceae bacterium]|nr:CPBP family intramembrane metalloprotease [Oscillospiraceae bacterium]
MNTFSLRETEPVFDRIRKDPRARVIRNIVLLLLVFVALWISDVIVQTLGSIVVMIPKMIASMATGNPLQPEELNIGMREALFFTIGCIVVCLIFSLAIERRKARTLGLTKRHCVRDYLIGAVLGVAMMGAAVMIEWAGGGVRFVEVVKEIPVVSMIIYFIGWIIQGFSEELMFRGVYMMSTGTHHKPVTAVVISSVLFACAHLGNDGISFFAMVNLILFGVFAAIYFLRTDSIWGIAAIHSMWNAAQGNVFGFKVSGNEIPETFLRFAQTDGHTWLNGGAFGPEGGAAVTIVLLTGIVIMFLLPQRKAEDAIATQAAAEE